MLRLFLALIILLHGLIHFIGFAKAFGFGNISQISSDVSRPAGMLWSLTAFLFIVTAIIFFIKKDWWWMTGLAAVILSQILISTVWSDARVGTIANVIILVASILSYGSWQFEKNFRKDVADGIESVASNTQALITETDIEHLPVPLQNYLRYVGVLHKPRLTNYKISFNGEMREKGKDWFPFTSEQYNFIQKPTRLFFMKAKMYGITVPGYHAYKNGNASMQIKLFGLFPIINEKEGNIDKAETVTIFNDMCLLAPASLIDRRIKWEALDALSAKASYTVNDITIHAVLYFNKEGQLINFISDDRYAIAEKKQYRFSTPVRNYKNFNGYNLPAYGEAVWHYPDGVFAYGRFHLKEVEYNV